MTHVRRFNRFMKTQRQFTKIIRGHTSQSAGSQRLFDTTSAVFEKETAGIQTTQSKIGTVLE
jgi:hypothetical protein